MHNKRVVMLVVGWLVLAGIAAVFLADVIFEGGLFWNNAAEKADIIWGIRLFAIAPFAYLVIGSAALVILAKKTRNGNNP